MLALLRETGPYFGLVLLVWLGRRWLETRVAAGVETQFAERLEKHKHELEMLGEAARHTYQKRITEFGLFVEKKHAVVAEVYSQFRVAHGGVIDLRGLGRMLTFEEFNTNDITDYMKKRGITDGKQREVLSRWDSDRARVIQDDLRPYLRMLDIQEAGKTLAEARNSWLLNELYFSTQTNEAARELSLTLGHFIDDTEDPPKPGEGRKRTSFDECSDALASLKTAMRAELTGKMGAGSEAS